MNQIYWELLFYVVSDTYNISIDNNMSGFPSSSGPASPSSTMSVDDKRPPSKR